MQTKNGIVQTTTFFSLKYTLKEATIADLNNMNVKEAMMAVCGGEIIKDESLKYKNCDILRSSPSICKYIIGTWAMAR